jgi:hypothetical protein
MGSDFGFPLAVMLRIGMGVRREIMAIFIVDNRACRGR